MQISLRSDLSGPIYRQLFESLRLGILEGTWRGGQRLPASRDLAQQLAISRNTVVTAYDMLRAEGYLTARQGSGYFVAAHLPDPQPARRMDRSSSPARRAVLSKQGEILAMPSRPVPALEEPAFLPGLPDLEHFSARQWQQCLQRYTGKRTASLTGYQDRGGHLNFKASLCDYLRMSRGLHCEPDQVIAVSGSQAGLDLLARMLIDPGDTVAVEDPCYLGARDSFRAAGANLLGIPVDADGLQVDALNSAAASIKLVYTTPSCQFPLGATLSAARRLQLISWAVSRQSLIIEDDYDCEFRYGERPLSSLQGMDQQQRVIYSGTFSKVMFPGLRLGYLVVPPYLSRPFAQALRKTGQDPPLFLQAAMADFIRNGYFASHMRRMRKLYGEQQARFAALLQRHLRNWLRVEPTSAGMQLTAFYRRPLDQDALLAQARHKGLNLTPLSRYYLGQPPCGGLYLGFGGIPRENLESSVKTLQECFQAL